MPQKVKIFISYHDEHPLIKSEILTPIQTGCSSAVKLFDGMLCDNTGDNISAANDRYCELSAQYWVGTHLSELGNPDYIGFMHYRRHFIFDDWKGNPDWCWLPKGDVYFIPYMTPAYFKHLSDKNIWHNETRGCLYDVDGVLSDIVRTYKKPKICVNCESRLLQKGLSAKDIETVKQKLKKLKGQDF